MIFIGIDPGASGGIAIINDTLKEVAVHKMPETERDIWDEIFRAKGFYPDMVHAIIESVHSMPKQGVASSFKFGRNYGMLRGFLIASGIPFTEVTPQKWQKYMSCMSRGDKNVTKAKAQQLFPLLKITHATADALLLAEYARRTYCNGERQCAPTANPIE